MLKRRVADGIHHRGGMTANHLTALLINTDILLLTVSKIHHNRSLFIIITNR